MAGRFGGKVVIVTGAASGIGAATARRFAAEEASVVLVDRDEEQLAAIAKMKMMSSDRVLAHVADVSDSAAVDAMMKAAVDRFGRFDVLINNAGVHEGGASSSRCFSPKSCYT